MHDEIKALLAARRSPSERRTLAAELRVEADRQERLADAEEREQRRPAAKRLTGGKGGRPGAMAVYVRIEARAGRADDIVQIRIGRGVYDAYQATRPDPAAHLRMTVQVSGGTLILTEDSGGYAVAVNVGGVTINASGSRDELAALEPLRRYSARVQVGRIVADLG